MAPHGEKLSRFEMAAPKANENPNFKHDSSERNLRELFKNFMDDFARRDYGDRLISGTGGQIGELGQQLGYML